MIYPGIAQLVARVVWECGSAYPSDKHAKPGKPCGTGVCGICTNRLTAPKIGFDHRNDHRQKNFKIQFPGIAQLVARVVWDHQVGGSSPSTRTKSSLKSAISEGFSLIQRRIF